MTDIDFVSRNRHTANEFQEVNLKDKANRASSLVFERPSNTETMLIRDETQNNPGSLYSCHALQYLDEDLLLYFELLNLNS